MIPVDTPRRGRSFVPVAIFVVGVLALSFYDLQIDPLIGLLLKVMVFTGGLIALRRTAMGAWRGEDRLRCGVACTVTVLMWTAWVSGGVNVVTKPAWFWTERSFFDQAVREAARGQVPSCVATKRCIHEPGRDADLAFPMGGMLDNWYGVVHAPAWQDPSVDRDRSSFDGDLVGCVPLSGAYFICSFT